MLNNFDALNYKWPPDYKIKPHARARSVRIKVSALGGLEVTVPKKFNLKKIPGILEEHKSWVIAQLAKYHQETNDELPTQFMLLGNTWTLEIVGCVLSRVKIDDIQKRIILFTRNREVNSVKNKLTSVFKLFAKQELIKLLNQLSETLKLPITKSQVRCQQTVWGTCNQEKAVSLNVALIFLPLPLVRYVIIHELCHTVHMDHSKQFWTLVESYDMNWREHRKALRSARKHIPNWFNRKN